MYIAALRLDILAMSEQTAAQAQKLQENQVQRLTQSTRRGYEWAAAHRVALANGHDVVTPKLAADKARRRAWQRAKKLVAEESKKEQARKQREPASAEPWGTSSWAASSACRRTPSARSSNWSARRRSTSASSAKIASLDRRAQTPRGPGIEVCIHKQRDPDSIDCWPKFITIYSHDRDDMLLVLP